MNYDYVYTNDVMFCSFCFLFEYPALHMEIFIVFWKLILGALLPSKKKGVEAKCVQRLSSDPT